MAPLLKRAQPDHNQQHDPIMLEHQAQRRKPLVALRQPADVLAQHRPAHNERRRGPDYCGRGYDEPPVHPPHEPGDRHARRVADHRREADEERQRPQHQPAAGRVAPALRGGAEVREDALIVDCEEDSEDEERDVEGDEAALLDGREAEEGALQFVGEAVGAAQPAGCCAGVARLGGFGLRAAAPCWGVGVGVV
jgi:hypothetical protein